MVDFGERHERQDDLHAFDELEQELRAGLAPLPAPEGFTHRVIARSRELPHSRTLSFAIRKNGLPAMARWSVAAAVLLAIVLGGVLQHHRQQRQIAGERARQQVLLALRITSFTLQAVRNRVDKNSSN